MSRPTTLPAVELATALNLMNERTLFASFAAEQPSVPEARVLDTLVHDLGKQHLRRDALAPTGPGQSGVRAALALAAGRTCQTAMRTYVLLICLSGPMLVRWLLQLWVRSVGWTIRGRIRSFGRGFPTMRRAPTYLARLRWPEGFRCPVCGGDQAWQTSTRHWKCAGCGRKTSVTAGTIFHRTRTPLSTWFAAIWLVTSQKNGASAQNLHDMLGLGSYETAGRGCTSFAGRWCAPTASCSAGVVEVDESFVGGRATGKGGASTDKVPVMIAVENLGTQVNRKLRLGRVRLASRTPRAPYNWSTSPAPPRHRVR